MVWVVSRLDRAGPVQLCLEVCFTATPPFKIEVLTECGQAPAVGWEDLYEIALLLGSVLCFVIFGLWERKFAKQPIMPLDIWTAPSFFPLIHVVTFSVMSYGIALWYMVARQQLIRGWTPLDFANGLIPHAILGALGGPVAAQ